MAELRNFYYSQTVKLGDFIQIKDSDFHHIKNVLKLEKGALIGILSRNGKYKGIINAFGQNFVEINIVEEEEKKLSFPIIHLIQGLPKGWKMDEIIEKSTELGVKSIFPVYMKRSIVKFSKEEEVNKQSRWNKIAIAASKQSDREDTPFIATIQTFEKVLELTSQQLGTKILFWELEEKISLFSLLQSTREEVFYIVVGPEGGITREEKEKASAYRFVSASLGDNILRTETAAPFSVGLINFLWKCLYEYHSF